MTKFLIIVGVLFLIVLFIINMIKKSIRSFVEGFSAPSAKKRKNDRHEEVLYKKDDVVVLKGDAGSKNNNP